MSMAEREDAAVAELLAGNIPESLRDLKPVRLAINEATAAVSAFPTPTAAPLEMAPRAPVGTALPAAHASPTAIVWVMPDYLAIGADDDFLRLPLSLPGAISVAVAFGFVLPTPKIVDAIHAQSSLRLEPQPMTPGPEMGSMGYFLRHQEMIEAQRQGRHSGELISGHKKDVVLTRRLLENTGRVAIYGWHRLNGVPIQPLSTVHGERYADYSHGVRLVAQTVWIGGGAATSIFEVLEDPELAPLLTREGLIEGARGLMR
jgi:hypothetical protein